MTAREIFEKGITEYPQLNNLESNEISAVLMILNDAMIEGINRLSQEYQAIGKK